MFIAVAILMLAIKQRGAELDDEMTGKEGNVCVMACQCEYVNGRVSSGA